ncbi:DnaJ-domain-containing protein [Sporormia fimetaria CBS 119925]|uniref:DnaJ-domain-containing protein n=1 Tax=Sporormia fimetaria CBS 119925 TaxID=1340428 RepID=A0A6A6V618_9PLEO|nr:DnaJ-domain-containing protein [Sporormia fimetaria CBS 119925]
MNEPDANPPSINPYEVLGLETTATDDGVKKAYRKLALKHHPDKVPDSEKSAAHTHFQTIAFAYAVLSSPSRRRRYDTTGSTSDSIADDDDFDWLDFYRQQFEDIVSEEAIQRIADEYKGSEEEKKDVLDAYTKVKGRLDKVYDYVMLSDVLEDDDRFIGIIEDAVKEGAVERYAVFEKEKDRARREKVKEAERKRRAEWDKKHGSTKEAAEKAKAKTKGKKNDTGGGLADLAALIQQRRKNDGDILARLEAKYAPKSGRSKKRATPMDDEPSEAAFQAAQKKMMENAPGKAKKVTKKARNIVVEDEDEDMSEGSVDLEKDDDDKQDDDEEEDSPPPKAKKRKTAPKGKSRAAKSKGRA